MLLGEGPTPVTVVEDEPGVRGLLADVLVKWNYCPQLAETAEQAVAILSERPTPILLTDLRMPGQGGTWLVEEVRRRWPETFTIVFTASHDIESAIHCLNAGASRYFLKPFDLGDLHEAMDQALQTLHRRRERTLKQRQLEHVVTKQTRRARALFLSGIESLFLALEARDPYISGHSRRVRRYARALGRGLGLPHRELRRLSLAAKLHDIGKVAVPENILHKADRLSDEERLAIQAHPVIGEEIIRPIVRNRAVLAAIRGHHERIDGGGYPDGLAGEEIPLLARMISVVDCFDALTSARPYRAPLSRVRAVGVLQDVAGKQLDAALVPIFVKALADNPHLTLPHVAAEDDSV